MLPEISSHPGDAPGRILKSSELLALAKLLQIYSKEEEAYAAGGARYQSGTKVEG